MKRWWSRGLVDVAGPVPACSECHRPVTGFVVYGDARTGIMLGEQQLEPCGHQAGIELPSRTEVHGRIVWLDDGGMA